MALRTVQPRKPKTPRPAPGLRTASPSTGPTKPSMLGALTNLATISGGTPPGGQAGDQGQAGAYAPWESDPVLQQIKSLQAANIAAAEGQAAAARNQALIQYGDPALAAQLGADSGTQGAAGANTFSTLSQLGQAHKLRETNLNENLNKANLFYSSTRGVQLGQEGQQYLGEQYNANQQLQSTLGQLNQGKLAANQAAQGEITQGTQAAYQRWLDQQLQYGLGNAGGVSGATMRPVARAALAPGRTSRTKLLRGRYA